jgi:hypothetical protein
MDESIKLVYHKILYNIFDLYIIYYMSLVVLKNKSRRYKAPVSGIAGGGFSIVGGRRNQGWVGQDNLARHLIRTPFRGLEPIGYGGKNGKYLISIIDGGPCCTNDPNIIKRSTMNTPGLFATRVKHPTGVFHDDCDGRCHGDWVKDFEPLNHSQSGHIKRIKVKTACNRCNKKHDDNLDNISCACRTKSYFIGGKRYYNARITKDKMVDGAITMGEYTDIGVMQKNDLPTPANKKAFPITLNHDGCDTNYATPEEAIAAGELPADWMMPKKKAVYNMRVMQVKSSEIENKLHNTQDFGAQENLIEFDYFMDDEEWDPYHAALNDEFPEDWLTNTAETDIMYSINPYL